MCRKSFGNYRLQHKLLWTEAEDVHMKSLHILFILCHILAMKELLFVTWRASSCSLPAHRPYFPYATLKLTELTGNSVILVLSKHTKLKKKKKKRKKTLQPQKCMMSVSVWLKHFNVQLGLQWRIHWALRDAPVDWEYFMQMSSSGQSSTSFSTVSPPAGWEQ